MHVPARPLLLFATVLIGCGGETDISGSRGPIGASGGGPDAGSASGGRSGLPSSSSGASSGSAGAGGAVSGGRGGTVPSSPRDASGVGASDGETDGAPPACPIRVSGTVLTERDCYACIRSDHCGWFVDSFVLPGPFTPESCLTSVNIPSSFWCVWYADNAPAAADKPTMITCKTNPGRVECGAGL
jgi:hypothetical protein